MRLNISKHLDITISSIHNFISLVLSVVLLCYCSLQKYTFQGRVRIEVYALPVSAKIFFFKEVSVSIVCEPYNTTELECKKKKTIKKCPNHYNCYNYTYISELTENIYFFFNK